MHCEIYTAKRSNTWIVRTIPKKYLFVFPGHLTSSHLSILSMLLLCYCLLQTIVTGPTARPHSRRKSESPKVQKRSEIHSPLSDFLHPPPLTLISSIPIWPAMGNPRLGPKGRPQCLPHVMAAMISNCSRHWLTLIANSIATSIYHATGGPQHRNAY